MNTASVANLKAGASRFAFALPTDTAMPRRNSPNDIPDLSDLSGLTTLVFDKRQGQRAAAKRNRRNRHYEKQFIRNTLAHPSRVNAPEADEDTSASPEDPTNLA